MNFKTYDILSSLVPGFLALIVLLNAIDVNFDKDLILVYTAASFLLGYILNTLGSWMEGFYFFTWRGKPSSKLLNTNGPWKVRFYESAKAKALLQADSANTSAKDSELFAIAMRQANGNARVDDFNAIYAFSRTLLTTVLLGSAILIIHNYNDWRYYAILLPSIFICWLRCKQRAYYYAREVLNVYIKSKNP